MFLPGLWGFLSAPRDVQPEALGVEGDGHPSFVLRDKHTDAWSYPDLFPGQRSSRGYVSSVKGHAADLSYLSSVLEEQ